MALVPGLVKAQVVAFMTAQNASKVTDPAKAMEDFAQMIEDVVFAAVKAATITIPPGGIAVTGTSVAQANPAPIILGAPMIS